MSGNQRSDRSSVIASADPVPILSPDPPRAGGPCRGVAVPLVGLTGEDRSVVAVVDDHVPCPSIGTDEITNGRVGVRDRHRLILRPYFGIIARRPEEQFEVHHVVNDH